VNARRNSTLRKGGNVVTRESRNAKLAKGSKQTKKGGKMAKTKKEKRPPGDQEKWDKLRGSLNLEGVRVKGEEAADGFLGGEAVG